uniref:Uncharacterized protein n=1 Tax=Microviridae sp. ctJkV4 TaxID=2827641 RepID=A0A8S5SII4_9VIRU|nr:MAG TPA: hypothetical protein [Microviridae sp. ctJkV4]
MNRKHDAHSAKKEDFIKPSSALAPHGRALKRLSKQRSKKKGYKIITKCKKH